MNTPPHEVDPSRQLFSESFGETPGRGRMTGRRVIVVGAGQRAIPEDDPPIGNGRAIAVLCAREGAQVVCVDMAKEAAQDTVDFIRREGGKATAEIIDVRNADAIAPLVERAAQVMGGLDGLALNVGISRGLPFDKLSASQWDDEYAVNVRSHMLFSQKALEVMSPGGAIVLTSSIASLRSGSRNPTYETSKAAQLALARSIAVAGEPKGIRANVVLPGLMDTPMGRDATRRRPNRAAAVPFGRQGTGWEVGHVALFLLSNEASYVNAHSMVVDGGLHVGVQRSG